MRRRIIPTRLLSLTLAIALFLSNDYTLFPLAGVLSNQTGTIDNRNSVSEEGLNIVGNVITQDGKTENGSVNTTMGTGNDSGVSNEGGSNQSFEPSEESGETTPGGDSTGGTEGEGNTGGTEGGDSTDGTEGEGDNNTNEEPGDHTHQWVEDPDSGGEKCEICGILRSETETPEVKEPGDEEEEGCEHEWVTDPETGIAACIKCGELKPEEGEEACEHIWLVDPVTGIVRCMKCGIEKPEEECEHEWVTDPETGLITCVKCGIEKPECEHEWIRDPETLEVVCGICGEFNEDYVEDECPESKWGFHIYEENEDGTGYVCVICGAEKETLDSLDITMEMFINSKYGINLMASETADYDTREGSDLPKNLKELKKYGKTELYVTCLGDLLVLQDISIGDIDGDGISDTEGFDFKGYTIIFQQQKSGTRADAQPMSSNIWNIAGATNQLFKQQFKGLGTEEFPFGGTVRSYYKSDVIYNIDKPLFNCLSTNATIQYMRINGVAGSYDKPMGLVAGTLVKKEAEDADFIKLDEVVLTGSVASKDAAGMMFGRVVAEEGTSITLSYGSTDVKLCPTDSGSVTGLHAGGFAGETVGDVILDITDAGVIGNLTVRAGTSNNWDSGNNKLAYGQLGAEDNFNMTPAGGMYVGAMKGGFLKISPNIYTANVQKNGNYGGPNGGFVGMAIGTEVTTDDTGDAISVKGTIAGSIAGGVLGYYEHPSDVDKQILMLDYITVSATVSSSANQYDWAAGGVVGRYYRDIKGATTNYYDTINHIVVNGSTIGFNNHYAGGVVGFVHGSNLRIGGEEEGSISVGGIVYGSGAMVGGVVGLIMGQYVEIQNAAVSSQLFNNNSWPVAAGGIVGSVGLNDESHKKSVIKITDVNVTSRFGVSSVTDANYRGGVLGRVYPGNMVALDGTITISMSLSTNLQYYGRSGFIAGDQQEALIYFETGADNNYTHNAVNFIVDDIGSYGGVYRNGSWGESEDVFSYEQGKVTGNVDGSWTIDSEADFIRLAVALNTEGRFAADCFSYTPDANKAALPDVKKALLGATYSITRSLDLKNSGIYSLNRNDYTGFNDADQCFNGTFAGSGSGSITIELGDITTRQAYVALLPQVGGGVTFKGFKLRRTIDGATLYGAGIACLSKGAFTAEDVYIDLTSDDEEITNGIFGVDPANNNNWRVEQNNTNIILNSNYQYYAGLVAYVSAEGETFTANSVKINGTLNATRSNSNYGYVLIGGMAAYYSSKADADISVNNFELMSKFMITSSHAYKLSGMITEIQSEKNAYITLSMSDIIVHNGAVISQANNTGSCGGWLGHTWNRVIPGSKDTERYSVKNITIGDGGAVDQGPDFSVACSYGGLVNTVKGRIQLKNIKINNGIFENNGRSGVDGNGLLFRDGYDAIIEIDGYEIDGKPIDGSVNTYNNAGNVQFLNRGSYYDEIVAYNIEPINYTNYNINYTSGGIVNIIYNGFKTDHYVYQNRLAAPKNVRTRYYYNLFGDNFEDEDDYLDGQLLDPGAMNITNEKQMMIWHLSNYMNASLGDFLKVYFIDGKFPDKNVQNPTIQFTAEKIDLNTVSYYPTPVSKGTYIFSSEVVFYGQDITTKATAATMTPSKDSAEHYMLHAGLFISPSGGVTVRGKGPAEGVTDPSQFTFLTLSGSVSNLSSNSYTTGNYVNGASRNNSGAVFVRSISGTKNIYYVRFNGLYLADYQGEDPAGLMIGIVRDYTDLDISWIETVNYETGKRQFTGKAASALIGVVGDYNATRISVEFKNMKLESRSDENGIFRYASLIDENYYKEDTENSFNAIRRIRYLFTKNAFLGKNTTDGGEGPFFPFGSSKAEYGSNDYYAPYVTVGSELSDGIEYWDLNEGPEWNHSYELAFINNAYTWTAAGLQNDFIPYVHRDNSIHTTCKEIEVNPKNGDITEGCGTYEDPYIISNAKQLLSLTRYLQNRNDIKYLGGWQINKFQSGRSSDNGNVCPQSNPADQEDSIHSLQKYPDTLTGGKVVLPEDFPTQDELCQAYYMIVNDIDLSTGNSTDMQIAEDFTGLGTSNFPFRGVIVGKVDTRNPNITANDGRPTLTMPYKSYWADKSNDVNYGLIQYAIGAVVKDLIIAAPEDNEASAGQQRTSVAKVENVASGVMAIVLGGDNIIDNVTVSAKVVLQGTECKAGAYAGIVEQGSLILRNIPQNCAEGFKVGSASWATDDNGNSYYTNFTPYYKEEEYPYVKADKEYNESERLVNYPYVSGLIGKVEDGCVIYEDNLGTASGKHNKAVLDHEKYEINGIYKNDQLRISKHYDIIVKSQLDNDITTNAGSIPIKVTYNDGEYTAQVKCSAQLQIVSMAINSDAFSIYAGDGGYKEAAVCRKANYDHVGAKQGTAKYGDGADRDSAVDNDDNKYYYPYLYRYFDFGGVTNSGGDRLGVSGYQATLLPYTFTKRIVDYKGDTITLENQEGYISTLNVATKDVTDIMNYELDSGKVYDLDQYCRGFRGIGATYGMLITKSQSSYGSYDELNNTFYSDFRANFNGNNATIKIGMNKSYDTTIHTTALFNDLLDTNVSIANYFTIENIVVTGYSKGVELRYNDKGEDITDGNTTYPNRTAGIIGMMCRPWKLSNITLKDMEVVGKGHTGGIVAWIVPSGKSRVNTNSDPTVAVDPIVDYEIIDCMLESDKKGTEVYSYSGSVGGIIGVVTQNVPTTTALDKFVVTLKGCQINGTETNRVKIEIKNKTKDLANANNDFGTQYGVGRSGGLIGYVGRKNVGFNDNILTVSVVIDKSSGDGTKNQDVKVEHAKITGAYSTGGLIGTYDIGGWSASTTAPTSTTQAVIEARTVSINSAQVSNSVIEGTRGNIVNTDYFYTYGVGGLIGEMRGYNLMIGSDDGNIIVTNTSVTSSENPINAATQAYDAGNGMYAGGVAGCIKVYDAAFDNIEVKGQLDESQSALELGGQKYTVKSVRSDAGGIIGFAAHGSGMLNMHNIVVDGMNITVDSRTEDQIQNNLFATKHPNQDLGRAGGVIGTNQMILNISVKSGLGKPGDGATVQNCMITGANYGVGGIVGAVEKYSYGNAPTKSEDIEDIKVYRNIIGFNYVIPFQNTTATISAVAGGVYGMVDVTSGSASAYWGGPHRVENALIQDNWIYGDSAGGILGYGREYQNYYSNSKEKDNIVVRGNNIYGRYVGGAAGRIGAGNVQYIGTNITDNHLQAYGTNAVSAYVGGFGGYIANTLNSNYEYHLDYIIVDSNDILAGNSGTNKSIYAGGLFGMVEAYSNFVYQPKLTDNRIGYSESNSGAELRTAPAANQSDTRGFALIQAMFNSSSGEIGSTNVNRTVQLIQGTNANSLAAVEMPNLADLKANGVGYYGGRIGNFAGGYSPSYSHTYILAPELSYGDTFDGSRPVIDVGMATTMVSTSDDTTLSTLISSPYAYRRNIHIIYHEPEAQASDAADIYKWDATYVQSYSGKDPWKNLFDGISYIKLMTGYMDAKSKSDIDVGAYLDAYRLNVKVNETQNEMRRYEDLYSLLYYGADPDDTSQNPTEYFLSPLMAGTNRTDVLPAIVLDTQYGTPDELINGVVASLTGAGGAYSDDDGVYAAGMSTITNVISEAWYVDTDGNVKKYDDGTQPSLKAEKNNGKWEVTYRSSGSYDKNGFDSDGNVKEVQTFTMLNITYSWSYKKSGVGDVEVRSETISIPIYAQERLNIDTHLKVMEGLQYNADKVKEEGFYDTALVASDSSYTFYVEYIYSAARANYSVQIPKFIGTYAVRVNGGREQMNFPAGAKLTLIDIDAGNKVYYYTVNDTEYKDGNIPFEAFKNGDENYTNKDISKDTGFKIYTDTPDPSATNQTSGSLITKDYERDPENRDTKIGESKEYEYTNVAVERFLITVDISDVDPNYTTEDTGQSRYVDYSVEISDNIKKKTTLNEHTYLRLTIQKGVSIRFMNPKWPPSDAVGPDGSEQTYISGHITADEDGFVDIWATIEVHASDAFWNAVEVNGDNTIDSSNHNKYLELQIYLTDDNGQVIFPSGTFGYLEGNRTVPADLGAEWFTTTDVPEDQIKRTGVGSYYDTTNIFFYKDGKVVYDLNNLSKIIMAERARSNSEKTAASNEIRWVNHMRLYFSNADMSLFTQEYYGMHIDLLRIEDPDYPIGGETVDQYVNNIPAARSEELACALEPDDLMQLGINTYDNQAELEHEINFDFKMDFNGVLTNNAEMNKEFAKNHYTVAYRIWQKQFAADGESYKYVPYTGNQLGLKLVDDPNGLQLTSATTKSQAGDDLDFWYVDYKFNWDEIRDGTKVINSGGTAGSDPTDSTAEGNETEIQIEGVIVRKLKLTVDDTYEMDLSNYKVQAILYVSDDDGNGNSILTLRDIDLDSVTPLSDFFIFTVAKLKTDLDY